MGPEIKMEAYPLEGARDVMVGRALNEVEDAKIGTWLNSSWLDVTDIMPNLASASY